MTQPEMKQSLSANIQAQIKYVQKKFWDEYHTYEKQAHFNNRNPFFSDHDLIAIKAKRDISLLAAGFKKH